MMPKDGGLTEHMNRTLEDILRTAVSRTDEEWPEHLAAAEFAMSASTGYTSFELDTGRNPLVPATLLTADFSRSPIFHSGQFIAKPQASLSIAKERILAAQNQQKWDADARRRHVEYEEGDEVFLDTKNLGDKGKLPRKFRAACLQTL
eukprot:GEZU01022167.1.p2 GENE.GEZU01022167.1~~GEZU01022167.1.p2  ORF type:complete len:148 (+),score=30.84 GEZU01022167.1:445-888(+)